MYVPLCCTFTLAMLYTISRMMDNAIPNINIFQEKNKPEFLQWSTAQINATDRAAAHFLIYELL